MFGDCGEEIISLLGDGGGDLILLAARSIGPI